MIHIIGKEKGIPFLRVYPGGIVRAMLIERPIDIDVLAGQFMATGGRFCIGITEDGDVKIGAMMPTDGVEPIEVVSETVPNDIGLNAAIDRVVKAAVAKTLMVH